MAMAMILVICKMSQESFGSFLSGSKAKKGDQNSPEVAPIRAVVGSPWNLAFPAGCSHQRVTVPKMLDDTDTDTFFRY